MCRPSFFRIWISLPIHVCDLAAWFAVAYLLTGARLMRVLLYYFGLFLSSQAFFTPVIGDGEGIGTIRFWLFFVGHTHIVGVALYDVIVLKYRPSWRDFFLVCTLGSAYVIAMIFLNRSLHPDANYGFLGPRDKQPAIIQSLGDYPMRIVWMSFIVIALFAIATAIWRFRRTPSRPSSPVRPS